MSSAVQGGVFSPERRALTLGIIISVLLIAFESLAVATVLPQVTRELNGLSLYGWSFSAFFVGFMISTVALGAWADRSGPAWPYLTATVAFGAGLLIAGLAGSMPVFILGRAVQGFGGGAVIAVTYLAINRAFPDQLRARVLALMSSAWVLPGLIGPAAASALAAALSWRAVFLALLPLLLLAGLLTLPALLQLPAAGTRVSRARLVAVVLVAGGVVLLLTALQRPLAQALPLGALGAALAVPGVARLYGWGTARLATPLYAGFAVRFLLTFGFFGAEALVPLGLNELRGLTLFQAGLALTAATLGWSTSAFIHSRLDERTGGQYRPLVVGLGGIVIAVSVALTGLLIHSTLPILLVALSWALGGAGMGFVFQAHTLVVLRGSPEGQEGLISGNLQLADMVGSALGAGLGGALVAGLGVSRGSLLHLELAALVLLAVAAVAPKLRAVRSG
ncbi:MFS transporter [Deinococcus sonorensis]|uniref:MFS transporter n=2 Tax=Deinococcus sonorensis TaxID=309891 RepID=A0AAU7UDM1_9DEIO